MCSNWIFWCSKYSWIYWFDFNIFSQQAGTMCSNCAKLVKRNSSRSWRWSVVFCSYILILIYSWYSRDHGAGGLFCAYIFILEILALLGFLLIYSFLILQSLPLNFLSLNAIFRWGWPANLCMCGDYKRRCRNGFKIRVSFPFFSKSGWVFLFSKSGWVFLSFQNPGEFSFLFKIRVGFPF